jgi:hypothetical protein
LENSDKNELKLPESALAKHREGIFNRQLLTVGSGSLVRRSSTSLRELKHKSSLEEIS